MPRPWAYLCSIEKEGLGSRRVGTEGCKRFGTPRRLPRSYGTYSSMTTHHSQDPRSTKPYFLSLNPRSVVGPLLSEMRGKLNAMPRL